MSKQKHGAQAGPRRPGSKDLKRWLVATACAAVLGQAGATENQARDYFPAPEGSKLGLVYFADIRADQANADGKEVANNLGFRGQAALLRWVYMDKCFGLLCNLQTVVPVQRLNSDALGLHASGLGDTIIGGNLWLQNDGEARAFVGFTNFLILPTGAQGVGAKRWQSNHMLNVTRGVGPAVLEGTLDLNFYGEQNASGGGTQKSPYYTLQFHASYDLTPSTFAALRYRYAGGGEEKTNGVLSAGAAKNHQLALELASWISARDQLLAEFNQDLKVENGLKQQQIWLRLLRVF